MVNLKVIAGVVRFQPTNMGHLIALAQMEKVGADLAVMNSGGIRDSIAEGDITYKDVLKVQPFANIVSFVELDGKELWGLPGSRCQQAN